MTIEIVSDIKFTGNALFEGLTEGIISGDDQVKALGAFIPGAPVDFAAGWIVPYDMTLSAANSSAYAVVPATAATGMLMYRNRAGVATELGTITFTASSSVGVILLYDTSLLANDIIVIQAGVAAESSPKDVIITLTE